MKNNELQEYVREINTTDIPLSKIDILDYMGNMTSEMQKHLLSFVLSQSHIFDAMNTIFSAYYGKILYEQMGYADRLGKGNIVPKVDVDGKLKCEEWITFDETTSKSKDVLSSLQSDDKTKWKAFSAYVKTIYEPGKMGIYHSPIHSKLNTDIEQDFFGLLRKIVASENAQKELEKLESMPIAEKRGIKSFFDKKRNKKAKEMKAKIISDEQLKENAIKLIIKYKANGEVMKVTKDQMEIAEKLLQTELSHEDIVSLVNGIRHVNEESSGVNYRIDNMLKQLTKNFLLSKKLYTPEILYANSFQDMTRQIRTLLITHDLKEENPLTLEYRERPLKNRLNERADLSEVIKGKMLSREEISEKMNGYDKEFEDIMQEKDPEQYVRRCTSLMMSFVSTHPFDDGNGRTSRMLLQVMMARRGILLPSNIDNYFERQEGTWYTDMETKCLRTGNYRPMEDYMVERVKSFNNGQIELDDEPIEFEKIVPARETEQHSKENEKTR